MTSTEKHTMSAQSGSPIPVLTRTDQDRFLSKASLPDANGCCLWTAAKSAEGYGWFNLYRGKMVRAHRMSYTLFVGPIPDGLGLDHRCHNRACVTPDHLRPVTHKQNHENRAVGQVNSKSGVRGVSPVKLKGGRVRWRACVKHFGADYYLGMFDTVAEAQVVVVAERLRLFTHNDDDRL